MTSVSNQQAGISRTERGLVITGTRITLYQLMDYIHAGHSPLSFRHHFPQITDAQFEVAISYIKANHAQVEAEYQIVVKEDEEIRYYWEEQNRERFANIAKLPPPSNREAVWEKLQAHKARLKCEG